MIRRIVALCETTTTRWPCVRLDDRPDDRQRARHDVDAALAAGGRDDEGVLLPAQRTRLEPRLHFLPRQTLPVSVVDLAQRRPRDGRQAVRLGEDRGGLERAPHRRAVDRRRSDRRAAARERRRLAPAFVGQRHVGRRRRIDPRR